MFLFVILRSLFLPSDKELVLKRFCVMRLPRQPLGPFGRIHPTLAPVPPRAGEDVDDAVLLEGAAVVEAAAALPRAVKVEHVAKVEV